jgi:hypothetical protein
VDVRSPPRIGFEQLSCWPIRGGHISRYDFRLLRNYLLLVLVVLLVVSPFLFFLCFVLVFTVPLVLEVSCAELVFWANIAVPLRSESASEAIMIFFIDRFS